MKYLSIILFSLFLLACDSKNSSSSSSIISNPGDKYVGTWQNVKDTRMSRKTANGWQKMGSIEQIQIIKNSDHYVYIDKKGNRAPAYYENGSLIIKSGGFKVSIYYDEHVKRLTVGSSTYKKIR